ncbi:hypothetical protein I7I53_00262 [Histoplasma capsulatum var. duboisii H88]|nr:hypothetical protein I7I53_00262 [Histoplasma capsulatum var. duboisii H88]
MSYPVSATPATILLVLSPPLLGHRLSSGSSFFSPPMPRRA